MALTKIPGSLLDTASGINGLIYPTSDGTSGQFLKTDGSGNLTFATVTTYTDSDVETYLDGGTSTPTFATATVSGTLTVTGDLDITGDINSYNVTDLDVTDKTITLGAGQTEANSGGSGIIIDGSSASILWDETNDEWDLNKSINVTGTVNNMTISASGFTCPTSQNFIINSPNGFRVNIDSNNTGTVENFTIGHNQDDAASTNILFRIGEGGKTSIGHGAANANLHIGSANATGDATNPALQIGGSSTYRLGIYTGAEDAIIENKNGDDGIAFRVKTAGEAMRIDAAGNLIMTAGGTIRAGGANDLILDAGESGTPDIYLQSGGATKVKIEGSNGSVLIGTTSSSGSSVKLEAHDATNPIIQVKDTTSNIICGIQAGNSEAVIRCPQDSPLVFNVGASETERMRIDSSGNVGIGQTSPYSHASYTSLSIGGVSSKGGLIQIKHSDDSARGYLYAQSTALTLESVDTNIIRFVTGAAERMQIDSSGRLLVGTTSASVGILGTVNGLGVSADGGPANPVVAFADSDITVNANSVIMELSFQNDTSFSAFYTKFTDRDATEGSISGSGAGSVSFNTTSDERLKENIVTTSNKLEKIKQIQVRDFNYIGKDVTTTGLIAQELNTIIPDVVREGSEDATKDPWGIDYGKLTPYLIKAIQEQQAQIEALQSEINLLKGE